MRDLRNMAMDVRLAMRQGSGITFLWVLGLTLMTPVILAAGLLALVGLTVFGTIRLLRPAVPSAQHAGRSNPRHTARAHLAPVVRLNVDDAPAEITLRSAA